ncbi:MAG: hypothetical protein AMJ65_02385 [Phycisphaerae bacterium SG8_4]|nr:MAG: hypothetical protein AMJ65_02385 [Phycisphaerae bacterium SG8_4]
MNSESNDNTSLPDFENIPEDSMYPRTRAEQRARVTKDDGVSWFCLHCQIQIRSSANKNNVEATILLQFSTGN